MLDMKALQSSLKGVRGRGKRLNENCHNHSNKPSRPRGSLIRGRMREGWGLMKTEEFSEKGVGGGGSIREHLNNEGLQKKGGLRPIRKGVL